MPAQLTWETIVSQPFAENSYVVRRNDARECIILDPGFEPQLIIDYVNNANLMPVAILNTHGHSDHIAGNAAIKQRWSDCPLIIGAGDAEKLLDPAKNLSADYGVALVSPAADQTVHEGEALTLGGIVWDVLETPGHSAGHVVFVNHGDDKVVVLGGDVLFQGSIGRTDFFDGSFEQLRDAIHAKLFTLPDSTRVLPGHGPETSIGFERQHNPFVGRAAGFDV